MRNNNNKHLGIEIAPELHYKLHYISKYEGRSANAQILYLLRQYINDNKNMRCKTATHHIPIYYFT